MSGIAPMYGRDGQATGGDPQVAELLTRTVDNQFKTTQTFDDTVGLLRSEGLTPWTVPLPTMAITHAQWLAAMLWQAGTSYLDAVVTDGDSSSIFAQAYAECDSLCDHAGRLTMEAIRLQSELDHGSKPSNATLMPFPKLNIGGAQYVGAWAVFEAVYLQVVSDMRRIEQIGIVKQMQDVFQTARSALQPKADVFRYLQSSWATATTVDSRKQLVREALPVATELFVIGQQLWAPYLFGQIYKTALQYRPTVDELDLGFDPWCLTDHEQRTRRSDHKESKDELARFWESVADPATAYQLSEQIRAAVLTRRLRRRVGRGYGTVPWPSQYIVRSPIQLGSRSFDVGDLVALYPAEESGKHQLEVRRTGRVTRILEMLGQQ